MKTKLLLTILNLITLPVCAQDMKNSIQHKIVPEEYQSLSQILREDSTSEITYVYGKFTCHNFAKKLFLERSNLITNLENYDLNGIEKEWGTRINREEVTDKAPIYIVTMVHQSSGFFHAINAVLINKDAPTDLNSYVFIEPQTDEILLTPKDLHKRYKSYYKDEGVKVTIGIFDRFKFNGNIYQSFQKNLYNFTVYPEKAE